VRSLSDLLVPGGSALSALVRGARRQQRLDAALAAFLDRPLAEHVRVGTGDENVLVLAADAPVWGHRIRYLAPAILERMREVAPELRDVRIIVRPPPAAPVDPPHARRAALSPASASLLQEVAGRCANPGLSRALARLAARARRPGG